MNPESSNYSQSDVNSNHTTYNQSNDDMLADIDDLLYSDGSETEGVSTKTKDVSPNRIHEQEEKNSSNSFSPDDCSWDDSDSENAPKRKKKRRTQQKLSQAGPPSLLDGPKVYSDDFVNGRVLKRCLTCGVIKLSCTMKKHISKNMSHIEVFERITYHKCKLCGFEMLFEYEVLRKHLRNCHKDIEMGDYRELYLTVESMVKCRHCLKIFSSCSIDKHLLRYHPLHKAKVDRTHYDTVLLSYTRCRICKTKLRFTLNNLGSHVRKIHNMSYEEYRQKYLPHQKSVSKSQSNRRTSDAQEQSSLSSVSKKASNKHLNDKTGDNISSSKKCESPANPVVDKLFANHLPLNGDTSPQFKSSLNGLIEKGLSISPSESHAKKDSPWAECQRASESDAKKSKERSSSPAPCQVQCDICQMEMDYDIITDHLVRSHKIKPSEVSDLFAITKPSYHTCYLCDGLLVNATSLLTKHVQIEHGMSLEFYRSRYEKRKQAGLSASAVSKSDISHTKAPESKPKKVDKPVEAVKTYSNRVLDICEVECPECGDHIQHHHFSRHMRKQHNAAKMPTPKFVKKLYHRCGICGTEILLSPISIRSHLLSMDHGKCDTYEEYRKLYLDNTLDQGMKKKIRDQPEDMCTCKCAICGEVYLFADNMRHMMQHGPSKRCVHQYHNKTFYRCPVCYKTLVFSIPHITGHVKKEHEEEHTWETFIHAHMQQFKDESGKFNFHLRESSKSSIHLSTPASARQEPSSKAATSSFDLSTKSRGLSQSKSSSATSSCGQRRAKEKSHKTTSKPESPDCMHASRLTVPPPSKNQRQRSVKAMANAKIRVLMDFEDNDALDQRDGHSSNDSSKKRAKYLKAGQPDSKSDDNDSANETDGDEDSRRSEGWDVQNWCRDGPDFESEDPYRVPRFCMNPHNMCLTRCYKCSQVMTHDLIQSHYKSKHDTFIHANSEGTNYDFVRLTLYRCKICGEAVLFSYLAIADHLKRSHAPFTLREYKLSYMGFDANQSAEGPLRPGRIGSRRLAKVWESIPSRTDKVVAVPGSSTGSTSLAPFAPSPTPKDSANKGTPGTSNATDIKESVTNKDPTPAWYNRSTFTCMFCPHTGVSRTQMKKHVKRQHASRVKNRAIDSAFSMTKEEQIECLFCGLDMVHEKEEITQHVTEHGIPLKDYEKLYSYQSVDSETEDDLEDKTDESQVSESNTSTETASNNQNTVSTNRPTADVVCLDWSQRLDTVGMAEEDRHHEDVYLCPLEGCRAFTFFEGMKKGSATVHIVKSHRMTPSALRIKNLRFRRVTPDCIAWSSSPSST